MSAVKSNDCNVAWENTAQPYKTYIDKQTPESSIYTLHQNADNKKITIHKQHCTYDKNCVT